MTPKKFLFSYYIPGDALSSASVGVPVTPSVVGLPLYHKSMPHLKGVGVFTWFPAK
jgi:hypothetical protein